jgi:hypothetical protein
MKIHVFDGIFERVVLDLADQRHLFGDRTSLAFDRQVHENAIRRSPEQSLGNFTAVQLQCLGLAASVKNCWNTPVRPDPVGPTPPDLGPQFRFDA